jgi:hypothetical protein
MSGQTKPVTIEFHCGGYFLTNVTLLNNIYQAAKAVVAQPDKFSLARLAKEIHAAEWGER